jgi:hypothetical protein
MSVRIDTPRPAGIERGIDAIAETSRRSTDRSKPSARGSSHRSLGDSVPDRSPRTCGERTGRGSPCTWPSARGLRYPRDALTVRPNPSRTRRAFPLPSILPGRSRGERTQKRHTPQVIWKFNASTSSDLGSRATGTLQLTSAGASTGPINCSARTDGHRSCPRRSRVQRPVKLGSWLPRR